LSQNFDESKKHAAVIIGAPYGGVKEQGSGIYALNMAERGFVALAPFEKLEAFFTENLKELSI